MNSPRALEQRWLVWHGYSKLPLFACVLLVEQQFKKILTVDHCHSQLGGVKIAGLKMTTEIISSGERTAVAPVDNNISLDVLHYTPKSNYPTKYSNPPRSADNLLAGATLLFTCLVIKEVITQSREWRNWRNSGNFSLGPIRSIAGCGQLANYARRTPRRRVKEMQVHASSRRLRLN
jgi:hypothetical protein